MDTIAARLNALLAAYEAKGAKTIRDSLQPGLAREQIEQACAWFPAKVPEPIIEMYQWRNGQTQDAWNEDFPFWFRDMSFSSLATAKVEYASMMQSYGIENSLEYDRILLATSFPFAAFNGGWYVVPADGHNLKTDTEFPVISVMEGIDLFYYSIETMLDTCIECVRSDSYDLEDAGMGEDEETEERIWLKHNPGIFDD
ncbi:MAG: hypothetical protein QNJ00_14795 [Woeseiaceae bacterium]|nr:hypothetical protein [Woeseiaceae bacterium]